MARKKLSPLVEAMKQYESLDERDRQTLADWIKASQPGKPRKSVAKKQKVGTLPMRENLLGQNVAAGASGD